MRTVYVLYRTLAFAGPLWFYPAACQPRRRDWAHEKSRLETSTRLTGGGLREIAASLCRGDCDESVVRQAYCAIDSGGEQGVCVERIPLRGACEATAQCATGICDGGTCEEHSGQGGPCVTSTRCFGECRDGVCGPYPGCL